MNGTYFLPYTGVTKFDELNDKIKDQLSSLVTFEALLIEKKTELSSIKTNFDNTELIFVPTIFDYKNSVVYQGVEFALRLYFEAIVSDIKTNFRIVLLGTEDKASFFQNCDYSNFLKCPNVEYLENDLESIQKYISNYNPKELDKQDAIEQIKHIGIKPPTSYKSHHSIANEWSILRWAKALKIETS